MVKWAAVPVTLATVMVAMGWSAGMAQVAPPGSEGVDGTATIRNTTGIAYLHPVSAGALAEGLVGFRASRAWGVTPRIAFEASALQMGGERVILQGAGAGIRLTQPLGPIRLKPTFEVVAGRAVGDAGGWWYEAEPGQSVYRPYRRPSSTPGVGAGLLTSLEWLHPSGIGVELVAAYWHLVFPETSGTLMVGGGLRAGGRDEEWWWRTSGMDHAPPRFRVESPEPAGDAVLSLGPAGVRFRATDRSGIRAVTVDGVPAELESAPAEPGEVGSGTATSVVASFVPPIHSGRHPLRVAVTDGAGNTGEAVVWVTGSTAPPLVPLVTAPEPEVSVETPWTDIFGVVRGASPLATIEIAGCTVETTPTTLPGAEGRAFRLRVPLEPGRATLDVRATDPLAGRAMVSHEVYRVFGEATGASGEAPRMTAGSSPSVSGRALRVRGVVQDGGAGVLDVTAEDGALAVVPVDGSRRTVEFLGYVGRSGDAPVDVTARTFDGRSALGTMNGHVRPGAAPTAAALLVGIEAYRADEHVTGPDGAAAGARALADALRARGFSGLTEERLLVLADGEATGARLRDGLRWLSAKSRDVDVVVVYLAGRAVTTATGEALGLVPYDAHATYGPGSLAWSEIEEAVTSLPAEVVVLTELVDGRGDAVAPPARARCGPGRLPAGGLAVIGAGGPGDGSFTRAVLEGLGGEADEVRLSDLIEAVGPAGGVVRTPPEFFDPALPLTVPTGRGGAQ